MSTVNCSADEGMLGFFENSLFIGDSVLMGYALYNQKTPTELSPVSDAYFHCVKSYTLRYAMKDSSSKVHPLFRGKNANYADVITALQPKNIFLFFGMNDIASSGVFKAIDNYGEFIEKIREVSPDVNIYILSTTYIVKDNQQEFLNNANITFFNEKMKEKSNILNVGWIDVADTVSDGCGNLNSELSSDGYVHLINSAYSNWDKVLTDYAKERL